jgi:thymidylate kinase
MIDTCPASVMEEIGSLETFSYSRLDFSFPSEHWKLTLEHQLGRDQLSKALATLLGSGYRPVTARQFSDTAFLVFARCSDLGFCSIAVPVPFTAATNALLASPRGLLLAVFGPDGVGKSSVMSAVVNAIAPLFDHQRTMRWRPQCIRSRIAKESHKFRTPHSADTHRLPISMAKLAGAFADFYLDHVSLTRNQLRGCSLIAWDRYFHDLAVDTKRYRYDGPRWFPEMLVRCLPVPDRFLGIVLDAEPELILRRKRELPLEEIRRQQELYRRIARQVPGTFIVKNEGAIEEAIKDVLRIFVNTMADWLDPLLPAVLNFRSSDIYAEVAWP